MVDARLLGRRRLAEDRAKSSKFRQQQVDVRRTEAGGVEGLVGVEGRVGAREGESVEVCVEQPVVDLTGPLGTRASWRPASTSGGSKHH